MAIRTVDEYKESLRDGRRVYVMGEKVKDVTTHPVLGPTCDTVGGAYELCASKDPDVRDLYVAPHPVTGEPISRFYITPHTKEDLANRSKMIRRSIEILGDLPFGRDIGTDCLNAAFVVAGKMGKKEYQDNAANFLEYLRKNDLFTCGAVTDVKGDRSKEPANQKHPDYYVHVVDKNKEGIIIKGAKAHITSGPIVNEIVVIPTRQMRENESEYAVSFAIPANTKGITFICRGGRGAWTEHDFHPDNPIRTLTEAIIIFDNVFVPWERVFMCGEWQHSMLLAYTFATFHRFTAISYKIPLVETAAGCAVAMAKYNGLEKVGHIRNNKLHFASKYHSFIELIQNIGGGIIGTAPDKKDWDHPDLHGYLEHYLGGAAKFSTEERMKMIHETMRQTCSHESAFHEVITVHAEGSMEAQKMMILAESPLRKYEEMAKRKAGIIPW
ncbi:MAG: 4-hydroxyphenylacetate 3-hydroxylase N-terminal domain-containing protein [Smithella sp.]